MQDKHEEVSVSSSHIKIDLITFVYDMLSGLIVNVDRCLRNFSRVFAMLYFWLSFSASSDRCWSKIFHSSSHVCFLILRNTWNLMLMSYAPRYEAFSCFIEMKSESPQAMIVAKCSCWCFALSFKFSSITIREWRFIYI